MTDADSTLPELSAGLRRRRLRRFCFWISMGTVVLGFLSYAVIRWHATADLQRCFTRNYEITFNQWGEPAFLPAVLDNWVYSGLNWLENRGHIGVPNCSMAIRERYRMLFRKPVRDIDINYPNTTSVEIGDALRRFSRLESFCIDEVDSRWSPDPQAMQNLAEALSDLGRLRKIEIGGTPLNDSFFREISTQPALETLIVADCYFSGNFVAILEELPRLKRLSLQDCLIFEETPAGTAAGLEADQQASIFRLLESIDGLEHLEELELASLSMGEENLRRLAALTHIETLSLDRCRLPESFPRILAESGQLRNIRLRRLRIDPRVSDSFRKPEGSSSARTRTWTWSATVEDEQRFEKAGIRLVP